MYLSLNTGSTRWYIIIHFYQKIFFCLYLWYRSQINNSKIGKVNRLYNRVEPFAALFWALGIVLPQILQQVTPGLASLNLWYWHGTVRQGSVWFNLMEEVSPTTLFLSCCTYSMVQVNKRILFITSCFIRLEDQLSRMRRRRKRKRSKCHTLLLPHPLQGTASSSLSALLCNRKQ